jgi:hypothetical protein
LTSRSASGTPAALPVPAGAAVGAAVCRDTTGGAAGRDTTGGGLRCCSRASSFARARRRSCTVLRQLCACSARSARSRRGTTKPGPALKFEAPGLGKQPPPTPLTVARHWLSVAKPQVSAPCMRAHHWADAVVAEKPRKAITAATSRTRREFITNLQSEGALGWLDQIPFRRSCQGFRRVASFPARPTSPRLCKRISRAGHERSAKEL